MVRYQVFLSFRGPETRHNLVQYLYDQLKRNGVEAFLDSEEIEDGQEISKTIVDAIESSDICVPVFSQDFASSAACLMEVAQMVKSGKEIHPIFFFVEPYIVRHRLGTYGKSFAEHKCKNRYPKSTIEEWEDALEKIGGIMGPEFKQADLKTALRPALKAALRPSLEAALREIGHGLEFKKAALEAALEAAEQAALEAALEAALQGQTDVIQEPESKKVALEAALKAAFGEIGVMKRPEFKEAALEEMGGTKGRFYNDLFSGFKKLEGFVTRLVDLLHEDEKEKTKNLVGVDRDVPEMMRKLGFDYQDGRAIEKGEMTGRWLLVVLGQSGVGKTTLTKVLFNKISHLFQGCSFLENVREMIEQKSPVSLQKKLIHDLKGGDCPKVESSDEGTQKIKHLFQGKRVLIVLDDVDSFGQIKPLAEELTWFGPGSRIILTTRKKDIVTHYKFLEKRKHEDLCMFEHEVLCMDVDVPMAVCDYNVFLSFRRLDVHHNFLECFHKQLADKGIAAFIDHKEIEYGERIDDNIGEAIKCSDICIPVLSKNFASSAACLMEVAQMVESGKTILPIFYGVKPSVVRYQQGTYGKAFAEHKKCRDTETIRKWKTALANIAELWGLEWVDVEHGHRELINNVDFKLQQLLRTDRQDLTGTLKSPVATIEHVIGIEDQVKKVIKLLQIEDGEGKLRMVGIHGTNGIGKTTIAQAVYNRLSSCFNSCSFLAEIGETAQNDDGIQCVQSKLIRDILERDGDVASLGGIKFFLDVFSNIKALIVLDDVEEQSHLDDLVGNQLEWFGPGSRIIVTSENRGILETCVSRGRADIYEVNKMDNDLALELFRKHASIPWYPEIGKRIVKATGQVPFVIEVIGSLLRGKTIEDWRKMEDLIKPHSQEILKDCGEILKICYEALDDMQEQIFWDIAWFANGVDSQIVSYMWPDLDLLPSYQVLMPLAKIGEDNMLQMHKLLKRLCRTIDKKTKLSRQYMHVIDLEGINGKEGMGEVEALCFDLKNVHPNTFTETDLKSMPRIRFLKLDHASMTGNLANVFPKLRWLRWQGCSTDFVATEFSLMELVILDLSWSKVTEDWGCWKLIKMEQLKVLNLTGCTDLLISPTYSSFPYLEILILERCSQLVHLDPSVGGLKKLLCLNLKSCIELNRLPDELGTLKALKELLIDETSVRIIPLGSDSKELETLSASNCVSLSLPSGVGELVKLRRLSLRNCHWIRKLPESIGQSPLEELDISGIGIFELPDSFGNLRRLRVLKMDHCFISKFPSFIWHLHSIEEIHASSCMNIEGEIPGDIRNLKNLRILRLRNSSISSLPSEIKDLPKLETLDVLHCDMLHELPALPSSLVIVHLSQKLKEKVSHIWDKHCFITV